MELDSELNLGEGHRADLLLDLAGLDKNERVMIQASIGNVRDFEKIAEALILQHPRPSNKPPTAPKKGKGLGYKGGKGKYKGRRFGKGKGSFAHHANFATDDYMEEESQWRWNTALYAEDEEPYSDPAHWEDDD